jgi:hypothetical protein
MGNPGVVAQIAPTKGEKGGQDGEGRALKSRKTRLLKRRYRNGNAFFLHRSEKDDRLEAPLLPDELSGVEKPFPRPVFFQATAARMNGPKPLLIRGKVMFVQ